MRRVRVVWQDSRLPTSSWQWQSELPSARIVEIVSVGFVVKDTKRVLQLAQSISRKDQDGDRMVLGLIEIPQRAIIERENLY